MENLKEKVKKILTFILKTREVGYLWRFEQLENELEISKKEIISIFDTLTKANLFYYKIIPKDPQEDSDFDIHPTKQILENRTAYFIVSLDKKSLSIFESHNLNDKKTKGTEKDSLLAIQRIEKILNSEKSLNLFLKKNSKHLKLPQVSEEVIIQKENLKINKETGDFNYFKKSGSFHINGQEYKLIISLLESKRKQLSYEEIIKIIYPYKNSTSKPIQSNINQVIKRTKTALGILPKNKKSNPNFIDNIRGFGYKINIK